MIIKDHKVLKHLTRVNAESVSNSKSAPVNWIPKSGLDGRPSPSFLAGRVKMQKAKKINITWLSHPAST